MKPYLVDSDSPLPRYYQVYASLQERIHSGELAPGTALPSERQLSIDYGVSRITIVKALDLLVDDDLIRREHGRGNFVRVHGDEGVCLENCRVAFCVPAPSESYILSIIMGATRVAMRQGVQLQIVSIGDGPEEEAQINALVAEGVHGVILFSRSPHLNGAFYQQLQDKHYPLVMVDRHCPEVAADYVVFDDAETTYRLTEILINQGHRRIALLVSTEDFATSVHDRLRGYRQALEAHGLTFEERWVGQTIANVLPLPPETLERLPDVYGEVTHYLHEEAPTAIVAINNYAAEQANIDLMQVQLQLMQAVIANNVPQADYKLNIALATISHKPLVLKHTFLVALAVQSGEELGECAMDLLIKRLSGILKESPQSLVVPMKIIHHR